MKCRVSFARIEMQDFENSWKDINFINLDYFFELLQDVGKYLKIISMAPKKKRKALKKKKKQKNQGARHMLVSTSTLHLIDKLFMTPCVHAHHMHASTNSTNNHSYNVIIVCPSSSNCMRCYGV